jgi:hypothetical protein
MPCRYCWSGTETIRQLQVAKGSQDQHSLVRNICKWKDFQGRRSIQSYSGIQPKSQRYHITGANNPDPLNPNHQAIRPKSRARTTIEVYTFSTTLPPLLACAARKRRHNMRRDRYIRLIQTFETPRLHSKAPLILYNDLFGHAVHNLNIEFGGAGTWEGNFLGQVVRKDVEQVSVAVLVKQWCVRELDLFVAGITSGIRSDGKVEMQGWFESLAEIVEERMPLEAKAMF